MKISRIKNFFLLSTKIISCFEYWFNTKKEIISLNSQIKNNKKYVLAYKLVLKIFLKAILVAKHGEPKNGQENSEATLL